MVDGPELEAADGTVLKADRRRPGRLADVSPELIPLLRGQGTAVPNPDHAFGNPDQLHGARGVAAGVAVGAAIWAAVGYAVYCIL